MLRAIVFLLWPIVGCAVSAAEPAPRNYTEAMACYEAFDAAREGWERYVGPVPDKCQHLTWEYRLELQSDLECPPTSSRTLGCHNTTHWIHIQAGMSPERTVETAVHEWMHALSQCVTGHPDNDHTNPSVFGEDRGRVPRGAEWEPETAQQYAISIAPVGPCLEAL